MSCDEECPQRANLPVVRRRNKGRHATCGKAVSCVKHVTWTTGEFGVCSHCTDRIDDYNNSSEHKGVTQWSMCSSKRVLVRMSSTEKGLVDGTCLCHWRTVLDRRLYPLSGVCSSPPHIVTKCMVPVKGLSCANNDIRWVPFSLCGIDIYAQLLCELHAFDRCTQTVSKLLAYDGIPRWRNVSTTFTWVGDRLSFKTLVVSKRLTSSCVVTIVHIVSCAYSTVDCRSTPAFSMLVLALVS